MNSLQDSLPKYIKKMFDDAHKDPAGKIARETQIVNTMFDKMPNGKNKLCLDKPLFQEGLKHYQDDYAEKKNNARPRLVAEVNCLTGKDGIQKCIDATFVRSRHLEQAYKNTLSKPLHVNSNNNNKIN